MTESTPDNAKPRAQTLAFQGVANRIVRTLLATPLIARGIGKRLVTLYVVGRKSGRHYVLPVAYTRHDGDMLIGTPFGWGKNLRTGEPIQIRYLGRRRTANVQAFADVDHVVEHYGIMAADNGQFASFNKIRVDGGRPNPDDLHAAWAAGARSFIITPV